MRWGRVYIIPTERKHARRASTVLARYLTRKFATEQVCGDYVLCVARTLVAPGTHVGGTAVEVSAGIKFYLPAAQTVPATHVGGAQVTVIAHCSITAACSLSAPASLKTRTGDVRWRYGSLYFGY